MSSSTKIQYNYFSDDWNEALPVGNGRLGAMVFSNPYYERLQLNEDSIWSGGFRKRDNKSALPNLQKVRDLLFNEKIEEAEKIINTAFCGTPINQRHYQPLGDLHFAQDKLGDIENFHRELDLETAINTTTFTSEGVDYKREVLASYDSQVIVINITANKGGKVNVILGMDGRDDYYDANAPIDDNTILFNGGMGSENGINFASFFKIKATGGKVYAYGEKLKADNCDSVTIYISAQTSYRHKDYSQKALNEINKAYELDFDTIKQAHIRDYQKYYNRASITLCDNSDGKSSLNTNERLENIKNGGKDNKLIELYYNFGRYLMISGSREGSLPLNLQGIWSELMWPAWGCKFTININTEMNYWPALSANLSECVNPLFELIEKMRPHGRVTAKEMYNCGGFVCHHNTDLWGDTAPQDLWTPGTQWPMGAAWLCIHIWDQYLYTKDKKFLVEKYHTLKEASEFFVDFLIEDKMGRLVTCPSVSPENTYLTESGSKGSICMGPSMDSQIIYTLFTAVIESAEILGKDKEFAEKLTTMRDKLPKPEIGKYGQIKEWAIDYDEVEPGHRHISQLFALYPVDMITVRKTPELSKAARATLDRRLSYGGGHTGWSRAWIINLWARLFDGEKVYENIIALLSKSTTNNMFDSHPPFQIDGNFGGAAGISEALVQSTNGEIILLPAVPDEWSEGAVNGVKARGGYEINFDFKDKKITKGEINTTVDGECVLVLPNEVKIVCDGKEVETKKSHDNTYTFTTMGNKVYELISK